uniref:Uncharacterized protein n=1 Tax=Daucus carota subsp. sativus TaxID=79200 RepID=A0A164UPD0_DAUCS
MMGILNLFLAASMPVLKVLLVTAVGSFLALDRIKILTEDALKHLNTTEDLHQAVMNLSGELYAKDVHFLMELIQNAEDNEYPEGVDPSLEFVVTSRDITATGAPATLLKFNNERGFTPRNIESICSVGRSTKKGNRRRGYIGEKVIESIHGIGTALPTTTIILPLKADKVKPVKNQLSNIHPEILLFLTKIKRLSVREDNEDSKLNTVSAISISSDTNFVTRKNIDAESYMLYLSADDTGDDDLEKECGYHMWQRRHVLVPANGSNWVELIGTNPWRTEGYVELGKDYLQPASYVGIHTANRELISFLKTYVPAFDIPNISPPDAVIPTMSATLTRKNLFLLLDWIRYLRRKGINIPQKFLSCIKEGSWLKISLNGSSSYRPPSQSFMFSSSGAHILQRESELVDIPEVDIQFYGQKIIDYKEELRVVGVMFEVNEACRFIGNQLMSIAASSNLSRDNVLSILKFIKFLRLKLLSPAEFINSIKGGRWLRTNQGDRSPAESILYNEEWKAAMEVSNIPLIDEVYYGANLMSYKVELGLIGVRVNFDGNYQLVGDNLKSSNCLSSLFADALYLILNCLRHLRSTNNLVHALKDKKCIKTDDGFTSPTEFYCLTLSGDVFYRKQASLHFIGKRNVLALLQYFKRPKTSTFPTNLKKCIREVKWLRTRLGDYRVPADCILYGQCWKSISSISLLPFIDDSDNHYGATVHEYEKELKSMGVVCSLKDGAHLVVNGLYLPQDSSSITPENVYSLLDCIRNYKPENHKLENQEHFPSTFVEKIGRKWLKTYSGFNTPKRCLLFSPDWARLLEMSDGPFLDEDFYGSRITEYKNELRSLGVIVDVRNGCSLMADYLDFHSSFTTVSRIYNYLSEFNWKLDDEDNKKIWVPSGTDNVKLNPSIDDYCEIWRSWEFVIKNWSSRTGEILAQRLLKLPLYSGSSPINLVNKHDVFIADDLQLKDLFERSSLDSLFVWYPQPSMKSLPRTKLLEIYSKIGVRNISESVQQELSEVDAVNLKQLKPKEVFIGKGLLRLILGFLADVSPKMEVDVRQDIVRRLLDVTVLEAGGKITMRHTLSLSSGETLNVEARQMLRWEKQISKLFVQKLDKDGDQIL